METRIINRTFKFWKNKDIKFLKNKYGYIPTNKLAKIMDRTIPSIRGKVAELKLKSKNGHIFRADSLYRNYHNVNYFNVLTKQNCYWAGFIAADGCITDDNYISIALSVKDFNHLNKFIKDINFKGKPSHYKDNVRHIVSIKLSRSEKTIASLKKYFNIGPRKSLTLKKPNITDRLKVKAYIKGYIDGDGCIHFAKKKTKLGVKKYIALSITGTKPFLAWIKVNIEKFYNLKLCKLKQSKTKEIFYLNVAGSKADKILRNLVKIKTPNLERKWDRIKEHKKYVL